jgi:hypothetical protein
MSFGYKNIWPFVTLLLVSKILTAQPDQKLIDADRQYRSGNYEKSLESLSQFFLMKKEQFIQKEILVTENLIALHYSEDTIRKELISIFRLDPYFDPGTLNTDISDQLTQRLKTIEVYPTLTFSMEGLIFYNIPIIHREPYVCEECVTKDHYQHNTFSAGIGFRAAFMINRAYGAEIGFGINSGSYQRNIKSTSQDPYKVHFKEDLQFLNVPIRIMRINSGWSYKAGINYRYLIKSDISAIITSTNQYGESLQKGYYANNSLSIRNRNLFFFSAEINRNIIDFKNQNWFISTGCEIQIGLNTLTDNNKHYNVDFTTNTYYGDDRVYLCFLSFKVALNLNAYHKIK